jgi:hypothetical protein
MARLYADQFPQAIDPNGNPISGAKLYFYQTGTSSPKNTYSDAGLTSPNTNPVVADSAGRFGPIYLDQDSDYKVILKDASDVAIGTRDPLLTVTTSVIAHQGSLIIGGPLNQDTELLIGAANSSLRSDGTTLAWRAPNYTTQTFLSGSGTYTRPNNCTAIRVRMVGGGGGGAGCGQSTAPDGLAGSATSFSSITAAGGSGGKGTTNISTTPPAGGPGGTGGSGTTGVVIRLNGTAGHPGFNTSGSGTVSGGNGGGYGAGQGSVTVNGANGGAASSGTGGGGGGAGGVGSTQLSGGGGGSGEYVEILILNPSATYTYAVGGGGAGGIGTGTGAFTGGAGAIGRVIVEEFYS